MSRFEWEKEIPVAKAEKLLLLLCEKESLTKLALKSK
jgi:CYTH domain-containing protein